MATDIPDKQYFKIGEVAEIAGVEPYVLRYWETEFKAIRPEKTRSNQRLYRRRDVETVLTIKQLLYDEGFRIDGAKRRLRELARRGAAGGGDEARGKAARGARRAGEDRRRRRTRQVDRRPAPNYFHRPKAVADNLRIRRQAALSAK